jgi:methylmalonyl-CoA mutase cobalamin-binding subunit
MQSPSGAPLQRALQWVVIPDLVRRSARLPAKRPLPGPPVEQEWISLAKASLESLDALELRLEELLKAGWSMDRLYLEGIAGAARQLGQWWCSDDIDFASLTVAAAKLQAILRDWDPRFQKSASPILGADQYTALLMGEFNSQHSLGVVMLRAFFKRDGWHLIDTQGMNERSLLNHLKSNIVHVFGLSVASDRHLRDAHRLIQHVRDCSVNPRLQIMVGGPMVLADPELTQDLKADWSSPTADLASREAYRRVSNEQQGMALSSPRHVKSSVFG